MIMPSIFNDFSILFIPYPLQYPLQYPFQYPLQYPLQYHLQHSHQYCLEYPLLYPLHLLQYPSCAMCFCLFTLSSCIFASPSTSRTQYPDDIPSIGRKDCSPSLPPKYTQPCYGPSDPRDLSAHTVLFGSHRRARHRCFLMLNPPQCFEPIGGGTS